jgi:outer membrane protein TolC
MLPLKPWSFRVVLLGLILACFAGIATGSEISAKTWTLEEALSRAFETSPALQASKEAMNSAAYKKKRAQTGFFPKLSTQYNYSYNDNPPKAKVPAQDFGVFTIPGSTFPVGSQDNYGFYITLEQPIFTGLALTTNYELAQLGVDLSKIKYQQEQLQLALRVKETYFIFLGNQKLKLVADQTVAQITDNVRIAQNYFQVGLIPLNDLLKSEVELAEARQKQIRAENLVLVAQSQLSTLLHLPLEQKVSVQDIQQYEPYEKRLSACQQEALQNRPEVKEVNTQLEIAQKNIQLARSEYYPQVYLQSRYKKEGDTPNVSGSDFTYADNFEISAGIKWNFWEWGRTHYLVQEKIGEREQVKAAFIQVQDSVQLEVQEAFITMKESEKNIGVAQKAIEQAEENFRISEVRFREQVATTLELFDAQTLLAQAKVNYYRALYGFQIAGARLQKAMGNYSF